MSRERLVEVVLLLFTLIQQPFKERAEDDDPFMYQRPRFAPFSPYLNIREKN